MTGNELIAKLSALTPAELALPILVSDEQHERLLRVKDAGATTFLNGEEGEVEVECVSLEVH